MASVVTRKGEVVQDPPFVTRFLSNPRAGLLFLPLRIWLGYQWLEAGLHKVQNGDWLTTGNALKGYWTNAIAIPAKGNPAIAFDWYRAFLQFLLNTGSYTWFAKLVALGEVAVGIALIIGAFTGFAALFGGLMNWNYMMAGSASTNPFLFVIAVALILGWKVAGYYGADYYLLRFIGTPWKGKAPETAVSPKPVLRESSAD
jgi:thiosulfate dehydrogenase [quinone] large subunit